jgi:hypothetical protein
MLFCCRKWVKPMEGAKERDDGTITFPKPSLGDSGHYICRSFSGREVHHYVSVVYQPDPLTATHTLYFKMRENCSTVEAELKELEKELMTKVLCQPPAKCPYTFQRTCETKTPAFAGFKFRLLLKISVSVPETSKAVIIPLIEHTKMTELSEIRRERPILLALSGNETVAQDHVLAFLKKKSLDQKVLLDEDDLKERKLNPVFEGNCKWNGSRLLDMICAPCDHGHFNVKKSPTEMTSPKCQACASLSSQAYYGATDCKNKPPPVGAVQPPTTPAPPPTPSPYLVMGVDMKSVAAMTVPELGGAVIAAIFVFGLLGYLVVTIIRAMVRKQRRKGHEKSLPSYHSLQAEEGGSNYSIKSYNSIATHE